MSPIALFSSLLILLLSVGCGRVSQVYQTPPGLVLGSRSDTRLDKTFFASELGQIRGRTIEVRVYQPKATINLSNAKIRQVQDSDWPKWRLDFQTAVANHLYRSRMFSDVSTPADANPITDPDLRLDIAVTEWNEGVGWLRYFLGFGLGATRMQWEGALYDPRANRVLFAFADARIHPGGPSALSFSMRPFHGGALIAEDLRFGTRDLVWTLQKQLGVETKVDADAYRQTSRQLRPPSTPIKYAGPAPAGAQLKIMPTVPGAEPAVPVAMPKPTPTPVATPTPKPSVKSDAAPQAPTKKQSSAPKTTSRPPTGTSTAPQGAAPAKSARPPKPATNKVPTPGLRTMPQ